MKTCSSVYTYFEMFNFFLRLEHRIDIRTIVTMIIITITTMPPSIHAQMMVLLNVSGSGRFGIVDLQSSSVSDSSSAGHVGSTLNTVPVTVRDGPLITHNEKNVTKSSAE